MLSILSGIYDSNNNTTKYLKKNEWHMLTDEDYFNGLIRFAIQRVSDKNILYISGLKKSNMIKCLKKVITDNSDILIDKIEFELMDDEGGSSIFYNVDNSGRQIFENDKKHFTTENVKKLHNGELKPEDFI